MAKYKFEKSILFSFNQMYNQPYVLIKYDLWLIIINEKDSDYANCIVMKESIIAKGRFEYY